MRFPVQVTSILHLGHRRAENPTQRPTTPETTIRARRRVKRGWTDGREAVGSCPTAWFGGEGGENRRLPVRGATWTIGRSLVSAPGVDGCAGGNPASSQHHRAVSMLGCRMKKTALLVYLHSTVGSYGSVETAWPQSEGRGVSV